MHCPCCGNDKTTVLETRMLGDKRLRRTRACFCGHKFRTYESHTFKIDRPGPKPKPRAAKAKPAEPVQPAPVVRKSVWFPS